MQHNLFLDQIPNQTQEINTIPIINHETHHTTEIETIHIIEIEVIQTIEIGITRTIDQEITHITDQTITDQMTIIKTDHGIIHKIEIQVIIINIEIIPNHHIGIITLIIILNIDTEVVHQNIKDILIKYSQMKKPSKLATAQGSTLVNYGKIQLFLLPTRTMEQNKILNKPFKQIFHFTDIKHNIIGIPFISK